MFCRPAARRVLGASSSVHASRQVDRGQIRLACSLQPVNCRHAATCQVLLPSTLFPSLAAAIGLAANEQLSARLIRASSTHTEDDSKHTLQNCKESQCGGPLNWVQAVARRVHGSQKPAAACPAGGMEKQSLVQDRSTHTPRTAACSPRPLVAPTQCSAAKSGGMPAQHARSLGGTCLCYTRQTAHGSPWNVGSNEWVGLWLLTCVACAASRVGRTLDCHPLAGQQAGRPRPPPPPHTRAGVWPIHLTEVKRSPGSRLEEVTVGIFAGGCCQPGTAPSGMTTTC
jgi:hypothetical protein